MATEISASRPGGRLQIPMYGFAGVDRGGTKMTYKITDEFLDKVDALLDAVMGSITILRFSGRGGSYSSEPGKIQKG